MIEPATRITFLDEFRLVVWTPESTPVPEFTLFDTLVPYGDPGNSQRFRVASRYHTWFPHIHVDGDRCLGTLDRDRPFTTDPTMAVLVMRLISPNHSRNLLIVRIQNLLEHAHSTNPEGYVPWDRWGRGVAVMEAPENLTFNGGPYPLVQGLRVNFVWMHTIPGVDGSRPYLCTIGFTRQGWSVLPLLELRDGVERRVSLERGRRILLQGNDSMLESWFESPGDTKFMYTVSNFHLLEGNSVADAGVRTILFVRVARCTFGS